MNGDRCATRSSYLKLPVTLAGHGIGFCVRRAGAGGALHCFMVAGSSPAVIAIDSPIKANVKTLPTEPHEGQTV